METRGDSCTPAAPKGERKDRADDRDDSDAHDLPVAEEADRERIDAREPGVARCVDQEGRVEGAGAADVAGVDEVPREDRDEGLGDISFDAGAAIGIKTAGHEDRPGGQADVVGRADVLETEEQEVAARPRRDEEVVHGLEEGEGRFGQQDVCSIRARDQRLEPGDAEDVGVEVDAAVHVEDRETRDVGHGDGLAASEGVEQLSIPIELGHIIEESQDGGHVPHADIIV